MRYGYSVVVLLALVTCASAQKGRQNELAALPQQSPEPDDNRATPEKVDLGKQLFFDPRLSGDNSMSCSTCHDPAKAFTDGLARAKGHAEKELARNTPSLLNVAFYSNFHWDSRAQSLEAQALLPIESPEEMNQNLDELEAELNAIPGYAEQFQKVFGTPVTREGIAKALAAFQRTLVTGPSAFDRYLAGDKSALSPSAKRGFELFTGDAGCVRCHNGVLLSDGRAYRIGIRSDDLGRGAITEQREDERRFRTPTLRNIAETAPYMHNGSMNTLAQVVEYYYRGVPTSGSDGLTPDLDPLLGQSYSEIPDLVAFLKALSSEPLEISPPHLPD